MVKTTINLDTEIYRALVKEALEKYGTTKTLSRIINEKLKDSRKRTNKNKDILKETFGIWKIKETGLEYTKRIRAESEERLERILNE